MACQVYVYSALDTLFLVPHTGNIPALRNCQLDEEVKKQEEEERRCALWQRYALCPKHACYLECLFHAGERS